MKFYVFLILVIGLLFLTGCIPTTVPMINSRAHTEMTLLSRENITDERMTAYHDGHHLVINDEWKNNTLIADYESDGYNMTDIRYEFAWNNDMTSVEEFLFFRNGTTQYVNNKPGSIPKLIITSYASQFEIRQNSLNWSIVK